MPLQRYSATHMFGAPIEASTDIGSPEGLLRLMGAYDIEGQDISPEPTDITPSYGVNSNFLYYLTLAHPEGPAVVELLPRTENSMTTVMSVSNEGAAMLEVPVRRIEVPTDQALFALVGTSPRFSGQPCVHELIVDTDQL